MIVMGWFDIIKISTRDAISDAERFAPNIVSDARDEQRRIEQAAAIRDEQRRVVEERRKEKEKLEQERRKNMPNLEELERVKSGLSMVPKEQLNELPEDYSIYEMYGGSYTLPRKNVRKGLTSSERTQFNRNVMTMRKVNVQMKKMMDDMNLDRARNNRFDEKEKTIEDIIEIVREKDRAMISSYNRAVEENNELMGKAHKRMAYYANPEKHTKYLIDLLKDPRGYGNHYGTI